MENLFSGKISFRENVRLIIWDLDETLWEGTLDEGTVRLDKANLNLVRDLTGRGILNSICSKNDYNRAEKVLRDAGVWDLFVLPSINWYPKGERVALQVSELGFRAPSVLFLDDNPLNCAEVSAAVPGIVTADASFARHLHSHPKLMGSADPRFTRLEYYRALERRLQERANHHGDNRDFLQTSEIRVRIEHDVEPHIDRVVELINRTNRLNFTQERVTGPPEQARQNMAEQVRFFGHQAGLVELEDRFGTHGFVGFFLKTIDNWQGDGVLTHFCFSCRVLGLGVERWVYNFLGRPKLKLAVPEMRTLLDGPTPDWINAVTWSLGNNLGSLRALEARFRGSCVVSALAHYFRAKVSNYEIDTNFPGAVFGVRNDTSTSLANLLTKDINYCASLRTFGFPPEAFYTRFFEESDTDLLLVANFWGDLVVPRYRNRSTNASLHISVPELKHFLAKKGERDILAVPGNEILMAAECAGFDNKKLSLLRSCLEILRNDYDFCDTISESALKQNLSVIMDRMPLNAQLVIILPPTRSSSGATRHLEANYSGWCRDAVRGQARVTLVSIDQQILYPTEHTSEGEDHFDRIVYFRLAEAIFEACSIRD